MEPKKGQQTIYQALAAAQAKIQAAGKSGENTYDHYKYAMLQDYCNAIHEPMTENGLALSVSVDEVIEMADRTTNQGKTEHVVRVKLRGILSHTSGETLEFLGFGEGQDRADKGLYKAITGGKKYLIANIFNVPTTDDPETDSHEDFDEKAKPHQTAGNAPKTETRAGGTKATPAAQNQRQMPPGAARGGAKPINDEEQIKKGLVNSPQIAELKTMVKNKGIPGPDFMIWLYIYTKAIGNHISELKNIPSTMYNEIYDAVVHDNGDIKKQADAWRAKQDAEAKAAKGDDGTI